MPGPDKKVSFLLNGGVDNRALDELVAPLVKQGDSPKLKKSVNTRLSVTPGGVVRAPSAVLVDSSLGAGIRVAGAVSAASGKKTLLLTTPETIRHRTVADAGRTLGVGTLYDDTSGTTYQRSVFPAQVVLSDAIAAQKAVSQIAVSRNATSGIVWHAFISRKSSTYERVMVVASTADGVSLSAPGEVAAIFPPARRWVGMTSHGANGDRVWYVNTAGAICYRSVTVSLNQVAAGAEVALVTPGSATAGIDVCRTSDTTVVLAYSSEAAGADGRVRAINVTNGATVTTQTHTNALQGGGHAALYFGPLNGTNRVVVGFSSVTAGTAQSWLYNDVITSMLRTHTAVTCAGRISVGFWHDAGAQCFVLAVDASSSTPTVTIYAHTEAAGALANSALWYWYTLAGHLTTWLIDTTHQYPILQLVPRHGTTNEAPGEANFVDDPSLDLAWMSSANGAAFLARLGVVRGTTAPVDVRFADANPFASHGMITNGDDLVCAYRTLADYAGTTTTDARHGRITTVRLGASNRLTSTHDRDGVGFLAGALPMQWDGRRVVELGAPLHTPHLTATKTVGGTVLAAGTYSYVAVYFWADDGGLMHRSRPSAIRQVTMNGTTDSLRLDVSTPWSVSPTIFEIRVYATPLSGKTFHLMAAIPWDGSTSIQQVAASAVTTANAQLFSGGGQGEELLPQPPPPAWDIAVFGQRCWIVDAEIRSRVVPSKLRIAGIGFEFTPGIEVLVPSGAGKVMAVREWQGMPVVLTERAVYQISGDGPSNTLGGGGAFSPPVKIADIGCSNLASIVVCPVGVLWQYGDRFVLLNGAGVNYIEDFVCTHDVSAAVALAKHSEVLFFSSTTAEVRVYHYESGRWTTYDTQVLANPVQIAQLMPWDQDTLLVYMQATGEVRRIEAGSTSVASMVFETDWLLPGGDFQDCVLLRDVIFNGRRVGAHSIRIELFVDYATAAVTDRTWNDAQIDAIDTNGYYSVRLEPTCRDCRAVKVRLTETWGAGAGLSPRSVTILYAIDALLREEAFMQGSRQ